MISDLKPLKPNTGTAFISRIIETNSRFLNARSQVRSLPGSPTQIKHTATPYCSASLPKFTAIYFDLHRVTESRVVKTWDKRVSGVSIPNFKFNSNFITENIKAGGLMAKRFTDTEKWADPWFTGMPLKMRLAWGYICDKCDGAGVWKVHLPLLSFYIGDLISEEEFRTHFIKRIVWLSDEKIWIKGFITFQYGTLSPNNRAHLGIMKKIINDTKGLPIDEETRALIDSFKTVIRPPIEGQPTLQVKEKEEYKVKEKVKVKEKENTSTSSASKFEASMMFNLSALFDRYPNHLKRGESLAILSQNIRDNETYESTARAIDNYKTYCDQQGIEYRYTLTFPKFWLERNDWLTFKAPTTAIADLSSIPWDDNKEPA